MTTTNNTATTTPEAAPAFETGDRVINRPGSWDRGQVTGTVRGTHTYDDGRVLVHVNHDDGCFTTWGANELERAGEPAAPFTSEIVEDPSVPTPCIVTLPNGGYDLDHDANTGRRELYIHSPADARSVGEALLAVADTCGARTFADDEMHICTREGDHDGLHRSAADVQWQSDSLGERFSEVVAELLAGADDAVYAAIGRGMVAIRAESGRDWLVNDLDVIAQAVGVRVSTMLERLVRS